MNSLKAVNNSKQFFAIHKSLSAFLGDPLMYPDFPQIPDCMRNEKGDLREDFSIYQKGTAFHIVNDGKGICIETFEDISDLEIVFSFTEYELRSEHVGLKMSEQVSDIIHYDENVKLYEEALRTVIIKKMEHIFPDIIQNKLHNLVADLSFPGWTETNWLCLSYYRDGFYIVPGTEVGFSRTELEQIKRAVFFI